MGGEKRGSGQGEQGRTHPYLVGRFAMYFVHFGGLYAPVAMFRALKRSVGVRVADILASSRLETRGRDNIALYRSMTQF